MYIYIYIYITIILFKNIKMAIKCMSMFNGSKMYEYVSFYIRFKNDYKIHISSFF